MIRFTTLAVAALGFVASAASAQPAPADLPADIRVPEGNHLLARMKAKGVQVYKAVEGKPGTLEWKLVGPLAELADRMGMKVGIHYDGPIWESADGSRVVRDDSRPVKQVNSPKPGSNVPWLLVPVKSDDPAEAKPGTFRNVVYVQRVSTVGGKAPTSLPKRKGSKVGVPYQATYYFWVKAEGKNSEVKDGESVFGQFTENDPLNSGGRREKMYAIRGEPGRVYKITREGPGTYWQWIKDAEGKLIVQGWPGEYPPDVLSYYYQLDKKETFYFFLDGQPRGNFKFVVTSYLAPKPEDVVFKDGQFEVPIKFSESDGVYKGMRQRSFNLKAEKDEKFAFQVTQPGRDSTIRYYLVVMDESGKELSHIDSTKSAFQAPANGVYRVMVAGMVAPVVAEFRTGEFAFQILRK